MAHLKEKKKVFVLPPTTSCVLNRRRKQKKFTTKPKVAIFETSRVHCSRQKNAPSLPWQTQFLSLFFFFFLAHFLGLCFSKVYLHGHLVHANAEVLKGLPLFSIPVDVKTLASLLPSLPFARVLTLESSRESLANARSPRVGIFVIFFLCFKSNLCLVPIYTTDCSNPRDEYVSPLYEK